MLASAVVLAACSADPSAPPIPTALPTGSLVSGPSPTPAPSLPPCEFPPEVATPSWLPADLPLPGGTYPSQTLTESVGYNRGIFVVPGSLEDLARFILSEFPASGWILGRGESEPGEIETQFSRSPAVGALKAQANYCDPGFSLMLLIYTPDRGALPSLGGGTSSPIPSG